MTDLTKAQERIVRILREAEDPWVPRLEIDRLVIAERDNLSPRGYVGVDRGTGRTLNVLCFDKHLITCRYGRTSEQWALRERVR